MLVHQQEVVYQRKVLRKKEFKLLEVWGDTLPLFMNY